jgi:hypothetical protein
MKRTIKIVATLLFILSVFLYLNFFSSFVFPWQKEDAIKTTLYWGGLAKLPIEMENIKVRKEGSAFSRTFIIEFNATQKQIENWIINSKRLKNNFPKVNGENKTYEIFPGENESFGGKVNIENGKVNIKISWS